MARAAAILICDGRVALIERKRQGKLYYVFPGGTVEDGETKEKACIREVHEELGWDIDVGNMISDVIFEENHQYYYMCKIKDGVFGTGDGEEYSGNLPTERGTYKPVWMNLSDITCNPVYPECVCELLVKNPDGQTVPCEFMDSGDGVCTPVEDDIVKKFVYLGVDSYISVAQLRNIFPFVFLAFITIGISIVGNVFPLVIASFLLTAIHALAVHIFCKRNPVPSFECRFLVNAFESLFLSLELQLLMYTALYAGKIITVYFILLMTAIQIISAALTAVITVCKIRKRKSTERMFRRFFLGFLITVGVLLLFLLILMISGAEGDVANLLASVIITAIAAAILVLFAVLTVHPLLRYYYSKKNNITCDEHGNSVSEKLIYHAPDKPRKRVLDIIMFILLMLVLSAILYGMYEVSR